MHHLKGVIFCVYATKSLRIDRQKGKSLKEIRQHDRQCYQKETIYDATDDKRNIRKRIVIIGGETEGERKRRKRRLITTIIILLPMFIS